uniref:Mas-related G protein-coupled receptor B n=2 Tax=Otolemur garnettii TaxID=30611 RepID=W8W3L9_OTOGA|nr:TPA: Mas-related G protein-coupled receptor B [Otolemur garnettii]
MAQLPVTVSPLESTFGAGNESLNQTTQSQSEPPELYRFTYISLFICALGVTGNGLLLSFLIFYIKRTAFTVYTLHLSVADFVVVLCQAIFHMSSIYYNYYFHLDTLLECAIFLMFFGYNTGLHLLTAMSVERCLSVIYPIWYHCQRPKHQSAVVCTLLWALSVLVSGLENFFCILDMFTFPDCQHVYILSCVLTLVFVQLMVLSNSILVIQACRHWKPQQPVKLYAIITTTVVLFLVFALPLKVLLIWYYYITTNFSVWKWLPLLNMLSIISSSANPIVYFVAVSVRRKKNRKKSLKAALEKVFEEKPVTGSTENTAQPSPISTSIS